VESGHGAVARRKRRPRGGNPCGVGDRRRPRPLVSLAGVDMIRAKLPRPCLLNCIGAATN
jgi:hypothetical protein